MPTLALHLLGPPQIERDGAAVATDRRKALALLAYLTVTGQAHAREALAALLWPEYDAASAFAYLRRTLWEINQMVGEGWLLADRSQVAWQPQEGFWLDVTAFRQGLQQAGDSPRLAQAVELYRGDFMAGFGLRDAPEYEHWQRFQAETLRDDLGRAYERLAVMDEERRNYERALAYSMRWVDLDPLHEPAQRLILRLLVRSGRRAAALRHYENFVKTLQEELGAEPEWETRELYENMKSGMAPVGARHSTADLSPHGSPHVECLAPTLPAPATAFVGRQREIAGIGRLLADPACRLLTLVGPGGIGKTRLAIRAASEQIHAFSDGVWFVPLATLESEGQMVLAIARALSFPFRSGESEAQQKLLDYLRRKRLLLVLDNLEQLQNAAPFLADILAAAPQVKLLCTSRVRLGLSGEHVLALDGLTAPQPGPLGLPAEQAVAAYSALELFVQSARRVQPDFQLTAAQIAAVAAICRRVDGMPLGIELAASWIGLLGPAEILAEIERSLDFLATDMVDVPERQRSLRAVFETSWGLMTPAEQLVFQQLSMFKGGFTREAAARVAGASPQTLMALANKSMLRRAAANRFELHPLLSQYAAERLAADPDAMQAARAAYCTYYLGVLQNSGRAMWGADQRQDYDAVEAEIENIAQAWPLAVELGRYAEANACCEYLLAFFNARSWMRALDEILSRAMPTLQAAGGDAVLLAARVLALRTLSSSYDVLSPAPIEFSRQALGLMRRHGLETGMGMMLSTIAMVRFWRTDHDEDLDLIEESERYLRQHGDSMALAVHLNHKASMLGHQGRHKLARELLAESNALCRQAGNRLQLARNLMAQGWIVGDAGEYDEAIRLFSESQRLFEIMGGVADAAQLHYTLGVTFMHSGKYDEAMRELATSRAIALDLGDRQLALDALSWLSLCAVRASDYERARQTRETALAESQEIADMHSYVWSVFEIGELHRLQGDCVQARTWYEESRLLFEAYDVARGRVFFHRGLAQCLHRTPSPAEADLDAAEQHYRASLQLATDQRYMWGQAKALCGLGELLVQQQRYAEGEQALREALALAGKLSDRGLELTALAGFAALLAATSAADEAATLAAFVLAHPAVVPDAAYLAGQAAAAAAAQLDAGALEIARQRAQELSLPVQVRSIMDAPRT